MFIGALMISSFSIDDACVGSDRFRRSSLTATGLTATASLSSPKAPSSPRAQTATAPAISDAQVEYSTAIVKQEAVESSNEPDAAPAGELLAADTAAPPSVHKPQAELETGNTGCPAGELEEYADGGQARAEQGSLKDTPPAHDGLVCSPASLVTEEIRRDAMCIEQHVAEIACSISELACIIGPRRLCVTEKSSPPSSPLQHDGRPGSPADTKAAEQAETSEHASSLRQSELAAFWRATQEAMHAFKAAANECSNIQAAHQVERAREEQFLEQVRARAQAKAQREEAAQRKFARVPAGIMRVKENVHGVHGVGKRPCTAREKLYLPYVSRFLSYTSSHAAASLRIQAVVRGHAGRLAFREHCIRQEQAKQQLLSYSPKHVTTVLWMQRVIRKVQILRRQRHEHEEAAPGANHSHASHTHAARSPRGTSGLADINLSIRTMSLCGDVRHAIESRKRMSKAFVSQIDMSDSVPSLRIDVAGACCRITPHGIEPSGAKGEKSVPSPAHHEQAALARALPFAKSLVSDQLQVLGKMSISAAARRHHILVRSEEVETIFAHYRFKPQPIRVSTCTTAARRDPAGGGSVHALGRGARAAAAEEDILGIDSWEEDVCTGASFPPRMVVRL